MPRRDWRLRVADMLDAAETAVSLTNGLEKAEFLAPLGVSQVALAAHIGVPIQRVNELVRGKRGVTPDTAWLLAQAFETTPDYWLNLQAAYDLARTRPARTIPPLRSAS